MEMREQLIIDEGTYIDNLYLVMNDNEVDLELKRNRVLEMQVDDAFNKGREYQDRLGRQGATA